MIMDELLELKRYITAETKCQCGIGREDLDPESYPYISILFFDPIPVFYKNQKLTISNMHITLKITVARCNELQAFESLVKLLNCLGQFNVYKGNRYPDGDSINPIETDNTYELDVPYILHLTAQDT